MDKWGRPTRTDGVFVSGSVCNVSNGVLAFVPQRDPRSTKYVMS